MTNWFNDAINWAVFPLFGWIWNTERRLTKLEALNDTVNRIDERTEKLVDHLIEH